MLTGHLVPLWVPTALSRPPKGTQTPNSFLDTRKPWDHLQAPCLLQHAALEACPQCPRAGLCSAPLHLTVGSRGPVVRGVSKPVLGEGTEERAGLASTTLQAEHQTRARAQPPELHSPWTMLGVAGASCSQETPRRPPEGQGAGCWAQACSAAPPLPSPPARTRSSCSSSTSTSSRGCGWGQPAVPRHDWTWRAAGPPPLALCTGRRRVLQPPAVLRAHPPPPTGCPLVAVLLQAALSRSPRCWRGPQLLVAAGGRDGGGRRTCLSASCAVGMGGWRQSLGLRGAGSGPSPQPGSLRREAQFLRGPKPPAPGHPPQGS